jgi:hypothetical protein
MPGSAVKDVKFGFLLAAGFTVFGILASVILAMSMKALAQ